MQQHNQEVESNASREKATNDGWGLSLDRLYHETDRLYYGIARDCGLSECAYWLMYALEEAQGTSTLSSLAERWCYSKQTVSSAVKTLQTRGLVEMSFSEGSRKCKDVSLTDAGRAFSQERVVPAMEAEQRAFETLSTQERAEFLRLIVHYTRAIHDEIGQMMGEPSRECAPPPPMQEPITTNQQTRKEERS